MEEAVKMIETRALEMLSEAPDLYYEHENYQVFEHGRDSQEASQALLDREYALDLQWMIDEEIKRRT